ncbi:MAG: hypothetical protein VX359_01875 [Chloroflexota bacterium]
MLKTILGAARLQNDCLEDIFSKQNFLFISFFVLIISCLCGAALPYLQPEGARPFSIPEAAISFLIQIVKNLFIFYITFIVGIVLLATIYRITDEGINKNPQTNRLTFVRHLKLMSIAQMPRILGLIAVLPVIRDYRTLSGIILAASVFYVLVLIAKSLYVSFGYNKEKVTAPYTKVFLVTIFCVLPSEMIFQLVIMNFVITLLGV